MILGEGASISSRWWHPRKSVVLRVLTTRFPDKKPPTLIFSSSWRHNRSTFVFAVYWLSLLYLILGHCLLKKTTYNNNNNNYYYNYKNLVDLQLGSPCLSKWPWAFQVEVLMRVVCAVIGHYTVVCIILLEGHGSLTPCPEFGSWIFACWEMSPKVLPRAYTVTPF